jgi:hypothetical protein
MKSATKALKKGKRFYKKRKFIKEKEKLGVNLRPEKIKRTFTLKLQ